MSGMQDPVESTLQYRGMPFSLLREEVTLPELRVDAFYAAIAHGQIVADFSSALIKDPERFTVFRDTQSRDIYRQAHAWKIRCGSKCKRPEVRQGTRIMFSDNPFTVVSIGNLEAILMPDGDQTPLVLKLSFIENQAKAGNRESN